MRRSSKSRIKTNLEERLDSFKERNEVAYNKKQQRAVQQRVLEEVALYDPDFAKKLTSPMSDNFKPTLMQTRRLRMAFNVADSEIGGNVEVKKELQRSSANQGILTAAAAANAGLNVLSRFDLGAASYNAQVAGKVIQFEDTQKFWENTKRYVFLAGSAGSTLNVISKMVAGSAVAAGTIVAIGATTAGQIARVYGDNRAFRGERLRQDLDSQYHQELYGNIVTRGNR